MKKPSSLPALLVSFLLFSFAAASSYAQSWTLTSPLYPGTGYSISYNSGPTYRSSNYVLIYAQAPGSSTWDSVAGGGGPTGSTPVTASGTISFSVPGTWTIKAVDGSTSSSPTLSQITRTVNALAATFTFSNLTHTYDGGAKTAGVSPNPSNATYTSDLTKGPNAGSYTVSATANGSFSGSGSATLTINKANQSGVGISPASVTVEVGSAVTFSAGGGGVGGYGWSGAASGTGSSKTVTFNSVGTSYVYVSSPGDGNYNASNTAGSTITITKRSQTITYANSATTYTYGDTLGASAPGGDVTFSVIGGTGSIAAGTNQITFNGVGNGTVTVRATQAGNATYNATTLDRTFTINPRATTFSLSPTSFVYTGGAKAPTVVPSQAGATFTTGGTLSATNVGNYTGSATAYGNFSGTNSGLTWSITAAAQTTAVTVTGPASVVYGGTGTGSASGGDGDGAYEWALGTGSTAPGAAVTSGGVISATGTGVVKVKARRLGGTNHQVSGWSGDYSVSVTARSITVTLAGSKIFDGNTTANGASASITAGTLAAGDSIAYAFGSTGSANVGSYTGLVTPTISNAVSPTTRTGNYAISYAGNYTIAAAATTFSLSPTSFVYNAAARAPTVVASPAGATFTTGGTLSATNVGNYTGSATATGNYSGSNSGLNWSITAAPQTTPVTVTGPASFGYGGTGNGSPSGGDGNGAYEWALGTGSTAPGAAITSGGVISATGTGIVKIKVRRLGGTNHQISAWSGDYSVSVTARPITVTLAGSKLFDGTTASTGASASITAGSLAAGDTIGYTFANTSSHLPGSYTGLATAAVGNAGAPTTRTTSYSITYAGNYLIQQNVINQAPLSISSANTFVYGNAYTATTSGGSGTGAVTWALGAGSTAPGAAINSSTGVVTALGTGTVVIKAQKAADPNYNASGWTADFPIAVTARPVTLTLGGSKTYNGTTTGTNATVTLTAGTLAPGDAIASYTAPSANVGTYTNGAAITNATTPTTRTSAYTITYAGNYVINPATLTSVVIAPLTYNGSSQMPMTIASSVPAGATVTISATAQTNAGSYTATVTGTGNFTGTLNNVPWTIDRAAPTGSFANRLLETQDPTKHVVNAGEFNAGFTGPPGAPPPSGAISYTLAGVPITGGHELGVGTYTVRATIAQTQNYASAYVEATWTVTLDYDGDGTPGYIETQLGTNRLVPNAAETSAPNPTGLKIHRSNP